MYPQYLWLVASTLTEIEYHVCRALWVFDQRSWWDQFSPRSHPMNFFSCRQLERERNKWQSSGTKLGE